MTLTEFLLARIASHAAEAAGRWEEVDPRDPEYRPVHVLGCNALRDTPFPCNCVGPAQVLAECEAKRTVVQFCQLVDDAARQDSDARVSLVALKMVLRALALPYADHPDYRDEWRP